MTLSTHTQCDRDLVQGSAWGGHAAASTQITPMCLLLVGAAAQGVGGAPASGPDSASGSDSASLS